MIAFTNSEIRAMPATPSTPSATAKSFGPIAALSLAAMLAVGCDRAKEQPAPTPAPTPAVTTPKPAEKPPVAPVVDAPKPAPVPDAPKPDEQPDPDAKPKPKPIPHTDLAPDAKPLNEFNTHTGVVIQEFKAGEGFQQVLPKAMVTVHFVMYIKDGWKKLESTYEQGEPLTALVEEFVWGMGDGLIGMKQGAVRRMIVPASRGYGEKGKPGLNGGPDIPPNSTLVFDVELVSIKQTLMNPTVAPIAPKPAPKTGEPDVNK